MGRVQRRDYRMARFALVLSALVLLLFAPSTAGAARSEFFGIAQGPTLDDRDLQGMAAAHIHTDRFLLNWGWVQRSPGSFTWGPADRFIGALASHGIRAVPTLWGNPDWVSGSSATPPIGGLQGQQAWRSLLKAVVGRYGPGGSYWGASYHQIYGAAATALPIRSWQIWNEPNLRKYFVPGPSPAKYARLLQISHDAIKSTDPQARIVLAGMPGTGDITAWDFLKGLYSVAGIKADFDAVALHPYAHDLDRQRATIEKVRTVMRNRGDRATPLWLTELAWGSAPPDSFGINKGLTGQEEMLRGSFELILSHRKAWNLQRLFWYRWRDPFNPAATCSFCGSAGLKRHNRTPKPALPTFKGFTAETTPPQASITAGPGEGSSTNDSTPGFSFVSNEAGSTFQCRVDASSLKACRSPYTLSQLSDGTHAFSVRAIDAPGNESTAVSRSFQVDTHAPAANISSGPANGSTSSNRSPSFSFTSNEPGVSFSCQLDGGGFEDCSSPFTASALADGSHSFQVKATDQAGNQGSTASRTWTVDGPLKVSISAGPQNGGFTNDPTPSFAFSSVDAGAGFSCRVGDGFAACTSPFTSSTLSDGHHAFTVKATDTAQNTDLAWRDFTVDTTAPAVTIKGQSNLTTRRERRSATFVLKASEQVGRRCRIDSRRFNSCSSRYRTPRLTPGTHTLKVKATDRAGNLGTKRKRFKIARKLETGVSVIAASAPPDPRCHGVAATLIGSPHADLLLGTKGRDVIVGFGGNDKINGRGGRDLVCARRGDDQVSAGWGDDRILGGPGSDDVSGGAGRDIIRGGSGFDACGGAPASRRFQCEGGS
jgi:Ca2+-binding RTX toxin-like protein